METLVEVGNVISVNPTVTNFIVEPVVKVSLDIVTKDTELQVTSGTTKLELNNNQTSIELLDSNYVVEINKIISGETVQSSVGGYFGTEGINATSITYINGGEADGAYSTITYSNGTTLEFFYSSGNPNPELNGLLESISDGISKTITFTRDNEGRYLAITYT